MSRSFFSTETDFAERVARQHYIAFVEQEVRASDKKGLAYGKKNQSGYDDCRKSGDAAWNDHRLGR